MKSLKKTVMAIILSLSFTVSNAQIKNEKTETVKVFGNCGMCKTTIEKAGNIKKVVKVNWDADTKMATLTYDAEKTNQDEILKRIALAGYDSEKFLAPDDVYNNLHGCCQYDREAKVAVKTETKSDPSDSEKAKQIYGEKKTKQTCLTADRAVKKKKRSFNQKFYLYILHPESVQTFHKKIKSTLN